MKLSDTIRKLQDEWIEEIYQEMQSGSLDYTFQYCKLLLRGTGKIRPQVQKAIKILQHRAKISSEAAWMLGNIFYKGKYVEQNLELAWVYFKIASQFKCNCGQNKQLIHSKQISTAFPCLYFESRQMLFKFKMDEYSMTRAKSILTSILESSQQKYQQKDNDTEETNISTSTSLKQPNTNIINAEPVKCSLLFC